jgi:glyoxylase-like metal-dependent hydrolase (beta-lactamase superfamily II)
VELIVPHLYASAPQPLPFAPSIAMRAFLCRRDGGNVLVYASTGLESETPDIERLGGASRHYLNHGHEAAVLSDPPLVRPILIHERDRDALADDAEAVEVFSGRHVLGDDFEVIPTPGHTPGATAYLWDTGEHRVLFTGDTIYLGDGEWVAAVLESSDRESYAASLQLIRELDFDVLAPWIGTRGQPGHTVTDPVDARRRIGEILDRVRRGASR